MRPFGTKDIACRIIGGAVLVAGSSTLTASCAETSEDVDPGPADSATTPAPDAGPDGDAAEVSLPCDGADWCIVPTGVDKLSVLKAIWGTAQNDVWMAGSAGAVAHFDGSKWTVLPSGTLATFNAVWGAGPNDIYLAGSTNAVFHTKGLQGGAAAFEPMLVSEFGALRINTVWGTSATDVRLGTDFSYEVFAANYFVLSQDDAGASPWTPASIPTTVDLQQTFVQSIWGTSPEDVWIAANHPDTPGRQAITLHGQPQNGGKMSFTEVDSQSSSPLESIHGTSAKDVWAVGSGGSIRHITDKDTRWQRIDSPTIKNLHAVWAIAPDDVWAVGDDVTILHYDGKSFTHATVELPEHRKPVLYGIWGSGPRDIWVVGDAITLHYTGPNPAAKAP